MRHEKSHKCEKMRRRRDASKIRRLLFDFVPMKGSGSSPIISSLEAEGEADSDVDKEPVTGAAGLALPGRAPRSGISRSLTFDAAGEQTSSSESGGEGFQGGFAGEISGEVEREGSRERQELKVREQNPQSRLPPAIFNSHD